VSVGSQSLLQALDVLSVEKTEPQAAVGPVIVTASGAESQVPAPNEITTEQRVAALDVMLTNSALDGRTRERLESRRHELQKEINASAPVGPTPPPADIVLPSEEGSFESRIAEIEKFLENVAVPAGLRTKYENRLFALQDELYRSQNVPIEPGPAITMTARDLEIFRARIIQGVVAEFLSMEVKK